MKRILLLSGGLLVLCACIRFMQPHRSGLLRLWEEWRYPAQRRPPAPDPDILKENRDRWNRKVASEHARLEAKLAKIRSAGLRVDDLEPGMRAAMDRAGAGRHREALLLLNAVEMRIPRRRERFTPADHEEGRP